MITASFSIDRHTIITPLFKKINLAYRHKYLSVHCNLHHIFCIITIKGRIKNIEFKVLIYKTNCL